MKTLFAQIRERLGKTTAPAPRAATKYVLRVSGGTAFGGILNYGAFPVGTEISHAFASTNESCIAFLLQSNDASANMHGVEQRQELLVIEVHESADPAAFKHNHSDATDRDEVFVVRGTVVRVVTREEVLAATGIPFSQPWGHNQDPKLLSFLRELMQ